MFKSMTWKKWKSTKRGFVIGIILAIIFLFISIGVIGFKPLRHLGEPYCGNLHDSDPIICKADDFLFYMPIAIMLGVLIGVVCISISTVIGYSIKNKIVLWGWIIGIFSFFIIGFTDNSKSGLYSHPAGYIIGVISGFFFGAIIGWIIKKIVKR